jgi:putative ATP-binding cassette transporter
MSKIDRNTARRFVSLALLFFTSEVKLLAWGLVILLLCLSLAVNSLGAGMSYIGRDFMLALQLRDSDQFYKQLIYYLLAFAAATPIVVAYTYTEQRLSLMWRRWLSLHILRRYLKNRAYYKLNLSGDIDNPDARIEEDTRAFCGQTLTFTLIIFNSFVQLCLWISILSSFTWVLPVTAVGYAVFGSLASYLLGRPLIGLNFAQLKKEADFRYKLVNIRDSAESIAFYHDEEREFTRTRQRLKSALNNLLLVINKNRNLLAFTTPYNYMLIVIPSVIVAPSIFEGRFQVADAIQAGVAFGVVINALSLIVNHFAGLSMFAAVINRLGTFWEALNRIDQPYTVGSRVKFEKGEVLTFDSVTITTPRREQMLVKDLSFTFEKRSLLICGPSGSGKSSILRVISGLWESGSGLVVRPDLSHAMFLPQRPYAVLGSLREQLLYGVKRTGYLDRELEEVLDKVHLTEMLERLGGLGAVFDWQNVLGTGEQQRLAFARVLLCRPKLLFMDEATTAIDRTMEDLIYSLLPEYVERYVSTGNRSTLEKFHDNVIELERGGSWKFS